MAAAESSPVSAFFLDLHPPEGQTPTITTAGQSSFSCQLSYKRPALFPGLLDISCHYSICLGPTAPLRQPRGGISQPTPPNPQPASPQGRCELIKPLHRWGHPGRLSRHTREPELLLRGQGLYQIPAWLLLSYMTLDELSQCLNPSFLLCKMGV
jgi:hypothetical protein